MSERITSAVSKGLLRTSYAPRFRASATTYRPQAALPINRGGAGIRERFSNKSLNVSPSRSLSLMISEIGGPCLSCDSVKGTSGAASKLHLEARSMFFSGAAETFRQRRFTSAMEISRQFKQKR
jgi:hypothetical protein